VSVIALLPEHVRARTGLPASDFPTYGDLVNVASAFNRPDVTAGVLATLAPEHVPLP
jgi:hypothetical protein